MLLTMKQELTLASLVEKLDHGRVHEAFQAELRRIIADLEDRPADTKPRKLSLEFKLTPVQDESGNLDEVKGRFDIKAAVPNRRTKEYSFAAQKTSQGHRLIFNDLSDEDINQMTIDEQE